MKIFETETRSPIIYIKLISYILLESPPFGDISFVALIYAPSDKEGITNDCYDSS